MRISRRLFTATAPLAATLVLSSPVGAQAPTHPLDELSAAEYWTLSQTLRADSRRSAGHRGAGS